MSLPNFIIGGPPKTGTTSIFDWLSKHPDAHPSKVKETYYFYDEANSKSAFPNYNTHGWSRYESLFTGWSNEKVVFEASPGYLFSGLARRKLCEIDDLKVLFVFRNTPERIFSAYQFDRFKTKKYKGNFEEFVGYANGEFNHSLLSNLDFSSNLQKWVESVPEKNLRVAMFGDLHHPSLFMQKLSTFLEIDDTFFSEYLFEKKNETFGLRNRKFHEKALLLKRFTPKSIEKIVTPIYYFFNKTAIPKPSSQDIQLLEKLREHYKNEQEEITKKFKRILL